MPQATHIFVTNLPPKNETVCFGCLSMDEATYVKTTDSDAFQIWEEYSDGWVSAPVCDRCKLSLPVFVDGTQPEEKRHAL